MHTYIGPNTVINSAVIGNYSSIAPGVQIGGMEHSLEWFSTSTALSDRCNSSTETVVGNNVWIAANAIIRKGVRIGDGAVVGAGAFVNKDVPENVIVVGSPARIIKTRLNDEMLAKISSKNFWNQSPKKINEVLGR
jgi:acetyltransferase-like isoleucine patch superfamily enzyme